MVLVMVLSKNISFLFLIAFFLTSTVVSAQTIGTWQSTNKPPISTTEGSCVTSSGYIYCVGGATSSGYYTNQTYYAQLSSSGIGAWQKTTNYPQNVDQQSCVAYSGYIYCVGGTTSDKFSTNTTYYAQLSSSGIGSWQMSTKYPANVTSQSCVAYNGYIYCIGGSGATQTQNYYAQISGSGIGSWQQTTNYPIAFASGSCIVNSTYIYCIGSAAEKTNQTYYAQLSSNGIGTWEASAQVPFGGIPSQFREPSGLGCTVSSGYAYCIGGYSVDSYLFYVYSAPLSSTGTGIWTPVYDYPNAVAGLNCVAYSGDIYCVSGESSIGLATNDTYYAQISQSTPPSTTSVPTSIMGTTTPATTTPVTTAASSTQNTTVSTGSTTTIQGTSGNPPGILQQIWNAVVNFFSHL